MVDYYELLGINENASDEEIRRAHREKLIAVHPDKNPNNKAAEETAKRLGEAKQILLDPKTRRLYDAARQKRGESTSDDEGVEIGDAIDFFEAATGVKVEEVADSLLDFGRQRFRDFLRGKRR